MFTKLQFYILVGCIIVAAVVFGVYYRLSLKTPPTQPATSLSQSSMNADGAGDNNSDAAETTKEPPETLLPDSYFDLTAKSHTDVEQSTGNQKIDANLEFKYAHQKTNDGIIVTLYFMELKMYQDGTFAEDTLMTRDKIVQQEGDQKTVTLFDDLPPEQQEGIAGAFATNLVKITLDSNQNELGRQVLSDAGFAVFKEGNLNTLRLMHGPHYETTNQWESVKRIPMTMGLILDCPLNYSKTTGNQNEVNVSGSLSKDEADSPQADLAIKNVMCSISGQEYFDEALKEYTSGKLTLQYKFKIFQKGTQVGTLNGGMDLNLDRVVAKK